MRVSQVFLERKVIEEAPVGIVYLDSKERKEHLDSPVPLESLGRLGALGLRVNPDFVETMVYLDSVDSEENRVFLVYPVVMDLKETRENHTSWSPKILKICVGKVSQVYLDLQVSRALTDFQVPRDLVE